MGGVRRGKQEKTSDDFALHEKTTTGFWPFKLSSLQSEKISPNVRNDGKEKAAFIQVLLLFCASFVRVLCAHFHFQTYFNKLLNVSWESNTIASRIPLPSALMNPFCPQSCLGRWFAIYRRILSCNKWERKKKKEKQEARSSNRKYLWTAIRGLFASRT